MPSYPDALRLGHRVETDAHRPLQDAFHLPALTTSVCEARRRVVAKLREWGADEEARDDAALLVSELFTNAVRHTGSARITCELWCAGEQVRLEVTDQGGGTTAGPRPRDTGPEAESGRGLVLVAALSDRWGVRSREAGDGRVVWAELPRRRSPAPGIRSRETAAGTDARVRRGAEVAPRGATRSGPHLTGESDS